MQLVIVCENRMRHKREMVLTPQRELMIQELRSAKDHPTADKLYQRLRAKLPRISLATVYRNLETLSRAGLIRKIEAAGSQRRFDGSLFPHLHMRCVDCGRVMDAPLELMEIASFIPRVIHGHQVVGHNLEILVSCVSCQRSKTTQNKG